MTDNEIIKALKELLETALYNGDLQSTETISKALDLINRQNAKNESLEVSLQAMRNAANGFKSAYERAEGARNTAIQDFAERLTHTLVINNEENTEFFDFSYTLETIDNLVKEMIGGNNDRTKIYRRGEDIVAVESER